MDCFHSITIIFFHHRRNMQDLLGSLDEVKVAYVMYMNIT